MTTIREMQQQVHDLAVSKGWHEDRDITSPHVLGSMLALIHSEVSEALEDVRGGRMEVRYRDTETGEILTQEQRDEAIERDEEPISKFKPIGFPTELADALIRILDTCGALGIDIERVVETKHAYNTTRARRHGGKAL